MTWKPYNRSYKWNQRNHKYENIESKQLLFAISHFTKCWKNITTLPNTCTFMMWLTLVNCHALSHYLKVYINLWHQLVCKHYITNRPYFLLWHKNDIFIEDKACHFQFVSCLSWYVLLHFWFHIFEQFHFKWLKQRSDIGWHIYHLNL